MSDIAIKIENLGKLYRLGEVGTGTISHDLNRWIARIRGKEDPFSKIGESNDRTSKGNSEYVWALKDLNFEVKKGEVLGIIGRNGAGKSTLLKLLSKVTQPTTGQIKVNGRIASLLEVGTGFHPEMTGRENVFLNGAIMGMTRIEIRRKFDEIVDFAGIERYVDTPVKRYSSGMYVRLAFAIAAHLEPEILIVDEVLAVGDAEFQKKCLGKMKDVSEKDGRTVLFVSHDLNAVSQLCTHGLLIANGHVEYDGKANDTISQYLSSEKKDSIYVNPNAEFGRKKMYIDTIYVLNDAQEINNRFYHDEEVHFQFKIKINEYVPNTSFFVTILDSRKRRVFSCECEKVQDVINLTISAKFLVRGNYSIHAFINQPKIEQIDSIEDVCHFQIIDRGSYFSKHGDYDYGSVFGNYKWI